MKGITTKLTKAGRDGLSLRTTFPASIKNQLDLKEGDSLNWELDKIKDEWVIIVKPIKQEKE
jgi:bifunctional DNA-binding transcriptional regulator/antitoxin component of YhaV-PrlF toxin-antitoxin module